VRIVARVTCLSALALISAFTREKLTTIIRAPRWHKTLYLGFFIVCIALAAILRFAVRNSFATFVAGMMLLLAVAFVPVLASAFIRRLELRPDALISVRVTGRQQCPVRDISRLQLSGSGRGLSRCSVIRVDGSSAFRDPGPVWRTADLVLLGKAMGVPLNGMGAPLERDEQLR
jgi:hypothetical protein